VLATTCRIDVLSVESSVLDKRLEFHSSKPERSAKQFQGIHTPDSQDKRHLDTFKLGCQVVLGQVHCNLVQKTLRDVVIALDVVVLSKLISS
jgi:hypothetical protein